MRLFCRPVVPLVVHTGKRDEGELRVGAMFCNGAKPNVVVAGRVDVSMSIQCELGRSWE